MPKRANPRGSQLERGFLLGMLYEQGRDITTARIRRLFRVSKATAKRDMQLIRTIVTTLPSKPLTLMRHHVAQRAQKRPLAVHARVS